MFTPPVIGSNQPFCTNNITISVAQSKRKLRNRTFISFVPVLQYYLYYAQVMSNYDVTTCVNDVLYTHTRSSSKLIIDYNTVKLSSTQNYEHVWV